VECTCFTSRRSSNRILVLVYSLMNGPASNDHIMKAQNASSRFLRETRQKTVAYLGGPSQIIRGMVPPKFVLALTPQPRAASNGKVSSGYTL